MSNMSNSTLRNFLYSACPRQLLPYWDRVESSPLGSRMARGAFWSIGGAVLSRGLMLVASILVARVLGREMYGEYGMIRSTVSMFLVFAGFGLGMTATKHVAEFRLSDPARAGRIMAISGLFAVGTGILIAVGLYIFAPWVATHTINAPHLVGELRIGAFILLLNAMNGAQTGALAGFEAFRSIAKVNLWTGLASFPLLIGGAYWGGLRGAVWALAANMIINWLLNHVALRREAARFQVPFSRVGCFVEWPILWRFSLPAALSGIMVSPVIWACNALLVNQNGGYGEMALFDAANQWRLAILFIPSMISQIALPMLSNFAKIDDFNMYDKVLKCNLTINVLSAAFVALPIIFLSKILMNSYGKEFEGGYLILIVLSLTTVFMAANNVVGQAIASQNNMWIGFLFNLLWAFVLILLSVLMLKKGYGALGLAYASLIAYFLHSIWQFIYVFRRKIFSWN